MLRVTLKRGDGLSSGRPWLSTVVKVAQAGLAEAGEHVGVDGKFGGDTHRALQRFQSEHRLLANGTIGKGTWSQLDVHIQRVLGERQQLIAANLSGFVGDLDWVHAQESHVGRPYWPGGSASGVTLDPGVDLGHQQLVQVERLYGHMVSQTQLSALEQVIGLRGDEARAALDGSSVLKTIRISREQAEEVLPFAARPYWSAISTRFPTLSSAAAPASVQTVLLSLAYNRGAANRHLEVLRALLVDHDWPAAADKIGSMQQSHELRGIRRRRRREAALIRAELELLQA